MIGYTCVSTLKYILSKEKKTKDVKAVCFPINEIRLKGFALFIYVYDQ